MRLILSLVFLLSAQAALGFPITSVKKSNMEMAPGFVMLEPEFNWAGQISMNCSGAVVALGRAFSERKALILTNGHCLKLIDPGVVYTDVAYSRRVGIFTSNKEVKTFKISRVVYATMTDTDISILELEATYSELLALGIRPLLLSNRPAEKGEMITMPSGYFQKVQSCMILDIVPVLKESKWTFFKSFKYLDCNGWHGTSGSPLISNKTGLIVGINNTHNDDGEKCTLNNPCEVDLQGQVTVSHGMTYGQETHRILTCLNKDLVLDLTVSGCELPKPKKN